MSFVVNEVMLRRLLGEVMASPWWLVVIGAAKGRNEMQGQVFRSKGSGDIIWLRSEAITTEYLEPADTDRAGSLDDTVGISVYKQEQTMNL